MRVRVLLIAFGSLFGCGDETELFVDLESDFVAGVEVDEAVVQLTRQVAGARPREVRESLSTADDLGRGVRAAEFSGLEEGDYLVRVILLDRGATRASTDVALTVTGTRALAVTIARSCDGVVCPAAGDPAGASACRAGRCFDPLCVGPSCQPADCNTSADCAAADCAAARCADGQCLRVPDDSRCGPGAVCDPVLGCSGVMTDAGPMDAAMPDASTPDASTPDSARPDARTPDSGVCPSNFLDPEFTDPAAWTVVGTAASVDPGATGGSDRGAAIFTGAEACTSRVVQTLCTTPDPSTQMVLSVLAQVSGAGGAVPAVTVDGSPSFPLTLSRSNTYQRYELCLGARAHGPGVELGVGGTMVNNPCGDTTDLRFDSLAIRSAAPGECPTPGLVRNGDFESDDGWTYLCCGAGSATYDPKAVGSGRELHLASTAGQRAEMLGVMSVPEVANPGLRFTYRTRGDVSGTPYEVSFRVDAYGPSPQVRLFPDTPTNRTVVFCLDPVNAGHAMLVELSFPGAAAGPNLSIDIWVDDLGLVDDASLCP